MVYSAIRTLVFASLLSVFSYSALAHGGRTNSEGCHNNKKLGNYHCHNSGRSRGAENVAPPTLDLNGSLYFKNCDAARAAGAAPLFAGEPGYGSHLDRDGNGIGCEVR